jgi:hypothetical protein
VPCPRPPAEGSLAVVTGASAGIGRGFALALARRGHPVLAVARRAERLEALAEEARAAGGAAVTPLPLDVTSDEAAGALRDAARALGPVGWVVNNAGGGTVGPFDEAAVDGQRRLVRLNCEAVVAVAGALLPALVAQRRGVLLNVGSLAGVKPTPGWSVYGATKAFVISFSEGLHEELRGSGVGVTALCPGPVATEFFEAQGNDEARRPPPHELGVPAVVEAGLRGALRGRAMVVPGATNKLSALAMRLVPHALYRRLAASTSLRYVGLAARPRRW